MTKSYKMVSIDTLLEIMAQLRDPNTGCPWDVKQSFATIAPYTIEEAYEVADAIAQNDMEELKNELGDLLLQVVFHAQMANEDGLFDFNDVVAAISDKMIRRHPHVFGDTSRDGLSPDDVKQTWDDIKEAEKADKGGAAQQSILDDIPLALPALTRAIKMQNRAARVGFDWPSTVEVLDKLQEEMLELSQELTSKNKDDSAVFEEFGDMLFVYANLARHLHIDAEAALRAANDKFSRRFAKIEQWLAQQGSSPEASTLDEMDALWNKAKAEDKLTQS